MFLELFHYFSITRYAYLTRIPPPDFVITCSLSESGANNMQFVSLNWMKGTMQICPELSQTHRSVPQCLVGLSKETFFCPQEVMGMINRKSEVKDVILLDTVTDRWYLQSEEQRHHSNMFSTLKLQNQNKISEMKPMSWQSATVVTVCVSRDQQLCTGAIPQKIQAEQFPVTIVSNTEVWVLTDRVERKSVA